MSNNKKSNELTLSTKIALIRASSNKSYRELAREYKVSLGAVSNILKRKEEYLDKYKENAGDHVKRKFRLTDNEQTKEAVWRWFKVARSKNFTISGPLLHASALSFANRFGNPTFEASSGWLEAFRKRHQIVFKAISGEAAAVDTSVVSKWKERLPDLLRGFEPKNIFNCDETALFFRTLPNKSLVEKVDSCKGGKGSKDRLTILFCASALGEKLKPLLI
jgi:hypothetical protein